jgi:hypothetical protein
MELTFEGAYSAFSGSNPEAVHMEDNSVYGFQVDSGRLTGKQLEYPPGDIDWSTLQFADFAIVTNDKNISLMRLKNVPRVGIYGVWHQDEVLDPATSEPLTPERHRLTIWEGETDISKYLNKCTITLEDETPVAKASLVFDNPNKILSGEDTSLINPGMKFELKLAMGDSEEYPISVQYIDRVAMGAKKDSVNTQCRNISGKLLVDQTLDEDTEYPYQTYHLNVIDLLDKAGVEEYLVQDTGTWQFGLKFEPNTTFMSAIREFIENSLNWKIVEDQDGTIIAGSMVTYSEIQRNSRYEFDRGSDVWSRDIVRDDDELYSRVCGTYVLTVAEEEVTQYIYVNVTNDSEWDVAPQKTLYIDFPKESDSVDVTAKLNEVADLLSTAGTQETFIGPIRPHLIPGDEAKINSENGSKIIGLVTTVAHTFSKDDGTYTQFTVDSSGRKGKPRLSTYIKQLNNKNKGKGERMY